MYEFLIYIFKNNLLENGALFLFCDYGNETFYIFEDFLIENYLSFLYIILKDEKEKTYKQQYEYIIKNQQIFIYPYEIYNTLGDIIYENKCCNIKIKAKYFDFQNQRGKSLLE